MKWKFKEWGESADLAMTFEPQGDSCEVRLAFTNIPERDAMGNLIHTENI